MEGIKTFGKEDSEEEEEDEGDENMNMTGTSIIKKKYD